MRRAATLLTVLTLATASAAWAAYETLPMDDLTRPLPGRAMDEVVIRVAPEDLGRCIITLMQVAQLPVDTGSIVSVRADTRSDAPSVRCVAE